MGLTVIGLDMATVPELDFDTLVDIVLLLLLVVPSKTVSINSRMVNEGRKTYIS